MIDEAGSNSINNQLYGSTDTFQPDVYRDKKGYYCIDYLFSSKGTYDVHFLKSGEYLATYAVTSVK